MKRALPYLAVVAVIGCGGATTAFTRTGPTLAAQPEKCEFSVVAASPNEPSKELGTIDIKYEKQTDWIYDESAFKRKVRTDVCQSGGDTVVAHINDNGLYMSATVFTTKAAAVTTPIPAASSEPDATAEAEAPAPPPPAATTTAPEKSTQAAATPAKQAAATPAKQAAATPAKQAAATPAKQAATTPAKKEEAAKDDDAAKPANGKKRSKKGASAKKDEDIHGKDGKVDIDKLL